jgi:hypothetical protein
LTPDSMGSLGIPVPSRIAQNLTQPEYQLLVPNLFHRNLGLDIEINRTEIQLAGSPDLRNCPPAVL